MPNPLQGFKFLLFPPSPSFSLCYQVHGSRVVGYGGDPQSLDLRKDTMGAGLKGAVGCEWLALFNAPGSVLEAGYLRMSEDAVNNNLKALFVVEVVHLLPAFTVPLEILTFGLREWRVWDLHLSADG